MKEEFNYTDEKFADLQMLRYRLDGFETLSLNQKLYIYYLSQATLCGRDITTDQFCKYNLLIRRTLEAVYVNYEGCRDCDEFRAIELYLKRLWFSNGIHHHYGQDKFVPNFTEIYFRDVVRATANVECEGVVSRMLPLCEGESVDSLLKVLCPVMFDPKRLPKRVNQNAGEDLVATSACNYYNNLTQEEVEAYYNAIRDDSDPTPISYGLNSTLCKTSGGELREDVWHEGGRYGKAISHIIHWLEKAAGVAENAKQSEIISLLVEYYKTGNLRKFDEYSIEWLKEHDGMIDFINGFIEVYGDPLGMKGSWEGIVTYKDMDATRRTQTISRNAQWFEDNSPVDARFKKPKVVGVTANVVCAAMLGGDEYPSTAIGINLPNADWIRAKHGSKSITIGNLTNAYSQAAHGNGFVEEFVVDDVTRSLIDKYGDVCDNLHTDLHECLGHGSGRLLPGVSADALGSYGSTIEEARADLFGLYYIADSKMVELGLVPNGEAYKSQYYTYMMNGLLTQLTRIQPGCQIEEAHMRNRALVARWTLEHYPSAVQLIRRGDKAFVVVNDYKSLREAFACLLAEIQRIKSEGDYAAAKQMIERYAVHVDSSLHNEVLTRYRTLGIAPYKGFINPKMILVKSQDGTPSDVVLDYTEGFAQQMLRYSQEYSFL